MPELPKWNSGLKWNTPGLRWNVPFAPPAVTGPQPSQPFALNQSTNMEYWEITKDRAQKTLPVWQQLLPALNVGTVTAAAFATLIEGFEPLVQARTVAQDAFDEAFRAVQAALLKMKIVGTKVPQIIEGQLDENEGLMADVNDLYAVVPRAESSILARARALHPVWVRANAALAALVPPQPPITRVIAGVAQTAALLKALLDGYTDVVGAMEDKASLLDGKRAALRTLDRTVDQLSKRWYKLVKAAYDPGSPVFEALAGIPTEPSTPAPDPVEVATVAQGGDNGLQVLVAYVPGGGSHATTKEVQWQIVGTDADFTHSAPLDASGNALGPFAVGTVVNLRTLVSNSVGTQTTAPRTITLGPPIV